MITHSGIEAFLSICRSKSITRAAEDLFICQSSLSVRLKTLENELGTTLFSRKKGQREIVLTESGKEFYEIALEFEKVLNRINKMRRDNHKKLCVSSLNSLGAYLLPEIYELFLENHPDIELIIQDYEFNEACKNILQGTTDIAFNTDNSVSERIAAKPIFQEDFAFICSKNSNYPQVVSADMLNVKKEVYVDWHNGFNEFHSSVFSNNCPQLRLNIMSQLKIFVEKRNNWAIVPISVAHALENDANIKILETDFILPKRTVYCLYSAERELENSAILFIECLKEILMQRNEVTSLLNI